MEMNAQDERKAFENWYSRFPILAGDLYRKNEDGDYLVMHTSWAFSGFIAGIEHEKAKLENCEIDPIWISVDFLLPELGTKVLIYIANEVISAEYTILGFVDSIEGAMLHQNIITHWMPRPVGPKTDKEGN